MPNGEENCVPTGSFATPEIPGVGRLGLDNCALVAKKGTSGESFCLVIC